MMDRVQQHVFEQFANGERAASHEPLVRQSLVCQAVQQSTPFAMDVGPYSQERRYIGNDRSIEPRRVRAVAQKSDPLHFTREKVHEYAVD